MKNLITWFAGFFEDQGGAASSKRAALYILLAILWMYVKNSIELSKIDKTVDLNILLVIAALIAWCLGAVTSEALSGLFTKKTDTNV